MGKQRRLLDEYHFPGFRPRSEIQVIFGDPCARVIRLKRIEKKRSADVAVRQIGATTTRKCSRHGICPVGMPGYTWKRRYGAVSYTHLRAHETRHDLVCRLLLE